MTFSWCPSQLWIVPPNFRSVGRRSTLRKNYLPVVPPIQQNISPAFNSACLHPRTSKKSETNSAACPWLCRKAPPILGQIGCRRPLRKNYAMENCQNRVEFCKSEIRGPAFNCAYLLAQKPEIRGPNFRGCALKSGMGPPKFAQAHCRRDLRKNHLQDAQ